jgi:hypothetical protein
MTGAETVYHYSPVYLWIYVRRKSSGNERKECENYIANNYCSRNYFIAFFLSIDAVVFFLEAAHISVRGLVYVLLHLVSAVYGSANE